MAKFIKGILGGFSGKIGTIVGANWRGIDIMRSKPRKSNHPATEAQLMQRSKFGITIRFIRPIKYVFDLFFGQPAEEKSRYNLAMAYHISEAIKGDFPNYEIDFQKVVTSKGELLGLADVEVSPVSGTRLEITWTDNSGDAQAKTTDALTVVVYNETLKQSRYVSDVGLRTDGNYTYDLPNYWLGNTVHCWVTAASDDEKLCSNSEYYGPFVLI